MKKLITNISDQMYEDIKKIKIQQGFFDYSETTRALIAEGIRKLNPAYIEVRRNKPSPEDKALATLEAKDARDARKASNLMEAKALICEELDGELEIINDTPHCRYRVYTESPGNEVDSTEMVEPFTMLTDENVRLQYRTLLGVTGEEAKKVCQKKN